METQNIVPLTTYDPPCCKFRLQAIADALYAIGGKWKLQIIVTLLDGKGRFNELQRTIVGISSKVLASELKDLELNGFVKRNVLPGPPVIVEYELTAYSRTLEPVLDTLFEWGVQHRDELKKQSRTSLQSSKL
ncbi:MAG: winged helix-turn-helix transcriptional regulator [Janthinobacterium lividum]